MEEERWATVGDYEAKQRRWREIEESIGKEAMDRVRNEIFEELGLTDQSDGGNSN